MKSHTSWQTFVLGDPLPILVTMTVTQNVNIQ